MNPIESDKQPQRRGIPMEVELSRKEYDLLLMGAKKWKQTPEAHVRWLIENSAIGKLCYVEEGAESRSLLRGIENEVRYSDSVSVETSPTFGKD